MNECTTKSLELYEQKRKTPEHDYGWCFENDLLFDKLHHQNSPNSFFCVSTPNRPERTPKTNLWTPKKSPKSHWKLGNSLFPSPIIFRAPAAYVSGIGQPCKTFVGPKQVESLASFALEMMRPGSKAAWVFKKIIQNDEEMVSDQQSWDGFLDPNTQCMVYSPSFG